MAWWPFTVALQGEAANHREVRRSRAGVLSVAEKARFERVRCGSRRRAEAIPPMKCRKRIDGIKTGVESLPRDQPGGSLLTGQVVSGMNGGASVVRALVWNSGTCRPDGTAGQWSGPGLRLVVWSENPKQLICEGESSDAGHRGGPTRISDEGPVMGLERRGRVVLAGFQANRLRAGGAG
jgi:hypothetical protein